MNLKEAFRFQNKLHSVIEEAGDILETDSNVVTVKKTYLYKKAMPEAENETVIEKPGTEYFEQITTLAEFMLWLLSEHEKLSAAISKTKAEMPIDMDSEISLNSKRQELSRLFKRMTSIRSSETLITNGGTGYCFNAEGNQVAYKCDVERVVTINFDRNKIRGFSARLSKKSDEISSKLDSCLINSNVNYEPPFDVNDSFAEIFDEFVQK